ncbi:MAG: hypothetical protein WAZ10_01460 [Minisyncoccia bacterium]
MEEGSVSLRMIFNVFRRRKGLFRKQWCAQHPDYPEISAWGRTHEEAFQNATEQYRIIKERERETKKSER